jgi:hypothetical protein
MSDLRSEVSDFNRASTSAVGLKTNLPIRRLTYGSRDHPHVSGFRLDRAGSYPTVKVWDGKGKEKIYGDEGERTLGAYILPTPS